MTNFNGKRGQFALIGGLIGILIALILVFVVILPILNTTVIPQRAYTAYLNENITGITNGSTFVYTLAAFSNNQCRAKSTLTDGPFNETGTVANYTFANTTGKITFSALNITYFGNYAYVNYSCAAITNLDDNSYTLTSNLPLFIVLGLVIAALGAFGLFRMMG